MVADPGSVNASRIEARIGSSATSTAAASASTRTSSTDPKIRLDSKYCQGLRSSKFEVAAAGSGHAWATLDEPFVAAYRGESSWGGVANEQCSNPTAETPAAVVRAHGLARSSRAVPAQWRPIPVDHVEQARLGTLRLTTIGRKSGQERSVIIGYLEDGPNLVAIRDERLGRGPSRVVAQPRGAPGRRHSIAAPAAAPGARTPFGGGGRDRLWQRWVVVDPRLDAYAVGRSTETPVIVLEPRSRTA